MKITMIIVFALMLAVATDAQMSPRVRGHYLKSDGTVLKVYQSAKIDSKVIDPNVPNLKDEPDLSKWNEWIGTSETYYFQTDNITKVVGGKEYIRIKIPNPLRWDPIANNFVSTPNYTNPQAWKENGEQIDAEDFNTWLWVSKDDYEKYHSDYYGRLNYIFVFSGLTTPFKYRFETKTRASTIANGDVNLGGFIGTRLVGHKNNWGLSIGGFGGVASLAMNASNNDSITDKSSQSLMGANYGGAIVVDLKNSLQFGVVCGFDHAFGNLSNGYVYQDKSWLGISLNYKFLDFGKTQEKQSNSDKH